MISTGLAFDALMQWVRKTDVRVLFFAIIAGGIFQQQQIVSAQNALQSQQMQLNTVQNAVEAQLVLVCLDSTQTKDLEKARVPCARLFTKYGIRP